MDDSMVDCPHCGSSQVLLVGESDHDAVVECSTCHLILGTLGELLSRIAEKGESDLDPPS
ncbi:hypothetical protein HNS03_11460 [Amorphus sp. 3PC139-8]